MYMCVYVYVYVCVAAYVYMHTCMCMCIYIYIDIYIDIYIYVYTYMYIYICLSAPRHFCDLRPQIGNHTFHEMEQVARTWHHKREPVLCWGQACPLAYANSTVL